MPKRKPRSRTTVAEERVLGKRRAPVWEKALAYVLAGHSLREASTEYGLPYSTVATVAQEDRWFEKRGEVDEAVRKRLTEEIVQRRLSAAKDVEFVGDEIAAEHENLVRMIQGEVRIALEEFQAMRAAGQLSGARKGKLGAAKALMSAMRGAAEMLEKLGNAASKAHETRRKVHRLDDEGGGMGESPLQAVLRRMRESGQIAAPVAVEAGHGSTAHGQSDAGQPP